MVVSGPSVGTQPPHLLSSASLLHTATASSSAVLSTVATVTTPVSATMSAVSAPSIHTATPALSTNDGFTSSPPSHQAGKVCHDGLATPMAQAGITDVEASQHEQHDSSVDLHVAQSPLPSVAVSIAPATPALLTGSLAQPFATSTSSQAALSSLHAQDQLFDGLVTSPTPIATPLTPSQSTHGPVSPAPILTASLGTPQSGSVTVTLSMAASLPHIHIRPSASSAAMIGPAVHVAVPLHDTSMTNSAASTPDHAGSAVMHPQHLSSSSTLTDSQRMDTVTPIPMAVLHTPQTDALDCPPSSQGMFMTVESGLVGL